MTEIVLNAAHLDPPSSLSGGCQDSLQGLQNLWHRVSYGLFVLDVLEYGREFRYRAFNPAIAHISPIPIGDLLGKTVTEALPLELAQTHLLHYRECVQTGQSTSFEQHLDHNDRRIDWLLIVDPQYSHPDQNNHPDQIDQLLVTVIDLRQRSQIEAEHQGAKAALAASEAKFRRLVENSNDVISTWQLDGVLTYISPGFQTLVGYAPSEWQGRSFAPLVHPNDLLRCLAVNQQVAETGETYAGLEFQIHHKQGHFVWVAINISPVKDETGIVIGFQGVLRDISDLKSREQAQARLLATLDAAMDVIGIADAEGNNIYLNPAGQKVLGISPAESNQFHIMEVIAPTMVSRAETEILPTVFREGIWAGESALLSRHGQEIPISQVIVAHKNEQGEVEFLSSIMRDISESKRQENALRFIVESTVSKTGEDFFRTCVQCLTEIFQVQYGFITELVSGTDGRSRMLALWTGEEFIESYEFDLTGTPCSVVFQETWGIFPDSLQTHFPAADALATLGAESYLGVVIVDAQGTAIGNLGIIHTQPITQDLNTAKFILQIFAARVGAEMERQVAKAKLQQQEAFLRTVYEGANQPIFVIDVLPDGEFRYVDWNLAAEVVSGMSGEEIRGKTPEEIYGVETGALERQRLQAGLASGQSNSYEECLVFAGQMTWWITTHNPIKDSQGRVYRFIGTAFEISDRKAAEAALQESSERQILLNQLSNQIRHSLDLEAVIATTIQAIRELLNIDCCGFAWYNPKTDPPTWDVIQEAKLENIPSALGNYPATLVGPVDQFLLNQEILRIDDGATYTEPVHRAFLQTIGCQSEILVPIQTHSHQIGVIICVQHCQLRPWIDGEVDLLQSIGNQLAIAISQAELYAESQTKSQELQRALQELQQTQAQMLQSEKMSSLGQLVAGIAHEINNPVNFIHGNLTYTGEYVQDLLELMVLYQQAYPSPTRAIADKIETIDLDFLRIDLPKLLTSMQVGTDRIREIVTSLRLFSRLDEAEVKPVDIHDGIDSTLMILHHRIKANPNRAEIQIIKHYSPLPAVECFAGQLNQVFMNILANAIDALDERDQGRSLEQQHQHPSTIQIQTNIAPDHQVIIRISDNGPGIPQEVQQRLFDPFFTTKPVGKGTGMGMSISYQIVTEKHRGQLSCRSIAGQGAEFIVQIPIQQPMNLSY